MGDFQSRAGGDGDGNKSHGFNRVGHNGVINWFKFPDAGDFKFSGAAAFDFGASFN